MVQKGILSRVSGSGKIILIASLIFILLSAAPVVNNNTHSPFGCYPPDLLASSQVSTISDTIKKGETASSLLGDYIPKEEIHDIDRQARQIFPLTRLRTGQSYKIHLMEDDFFSFEYEIDEYERLLIQKEDEAYTISKLPIEYEVRQEVVSVEIHSSLYEAVHRANEGRALVWKLADIFAWDIDFMRDIQPGDRFEVLVDKNYKEGKFAGYGDLKAAFFTNQGKVYKAFYHEDKKGRGRYYDEKGNSLEKAFLKAPLNFSRISSSFSAKRFHPILKKYRAHLGVDYAAPKNTPIKAVADGVISSIGSSDSTGRQITIRHVNGYETAYFHMNRFAKGMKRGSKISQGDIIGYVGKTGLATGYHLCFRMRKDGRAVNPLNQPSLKARPVAPSELRQYLSRAGKYTELIKSHEKLARNEADGSGS